MDLVNVDNEPRFCRMATGAVRSQTPLVDVSMARIACRHRLGEDKAFMAIHAVKCTVLAG